MRERKTFISVLVPPAGTLEGGVWRPAVDVYRTRSGWLLKFDVAGVRREDVSINVQACRITVTGVRRDWTVEEVCSHHLMEISYSRFERTIELPCDCDDAKISIDCRDGILLVRISSQGENQ